MFIPITGIIILTGSIIYIIQAQRRYNQSKKRIEKAILERHQGVQVTPESAAPAPKPALVCYNCRNKLPTSPGNSIVCPVCGFVTKKAD
nr:hypothetical protein [Candidatus Sigynarchaeota archaeon]